MAGLTVTQNYVFFLMVAGRLLPILVAPTDEGLARLSWPGWLKNKQPVKRATEIWATTVGKIVNGKEGIQHLVKMATENWAT